MLRALCNVLLLSMLLVLDVQGQSSFKDSLIHSNPVMPGADLSFEEKRNIHTAFLEAAHRNNEPLKQVFAHIYLFSDYILASDYSGAARHLLEAEHIAGAAGQPNWHAEVISRKAIISIRLEKTDDAIRQFAEASRMFAQVGDLLRMAECVEQLGATYSQMGDLPNAQQQYEIALPLLEKHGSERQMRVAYGNFANVLLLQNRPAESVQYLERSLTINRKLGDREKEAQDLGDLANAYAALKTYDKALECYRQSLRIATETGLPEVRYVTYSDMANTYEKMGDFRSAYDSYKKYHALRDSLIGAETQEKIADLEVKYDSKNKEIALQLNQAELARAKQSVRNRTVFGITVLLGLVLAIFIVFKIRNDRIRNAKIHAAQQKILEQDLQLKSLEQAQLTSSLAAQRNDLTDLALDITRKNDFVEELIRRVQSFQPGLAPPASHELVALQQFVLGQYRLDKEKALLHEKVEDVNREFYEHLNIRFGNLSRAEKDLCGLIRLQLSNKEIAVIKGISPNSAKIARYRLRKRLQLNEQDDIVSFLQGI